MAKKLGRSKKKRKYTRRNNTVNNLKEAVNKAKNGDTIFVLSPENDKANEQPRASSTSYVFVHGNKTLIRNLTDEFLNGQYEAIENECNGVRRELSNLENLRLNLSMEQRFRGLK